MKHAPTLDPDRLVRAVRDAYGITAIGITFIPVGFAAACYKLDTPSQAYFLKVWPTATTAPAYAISCAQSLRLTRALYDRDILRRVAYPLHTLSGMLAASYTEGSFALFPFLDGASPPEVWPAWLQDAWVATLVHIHQATNLLADVLPQREQYDFALEANLRAYIVRLDGLSAGIRPGLHAVQERMLAGQPEIVAQLGRLADLQQRVRRLDSPFVLCHTDMGSENLLVDGDGRLYVLDWDEASVAPPEHDLHQARWSDISHILKCYQSAGGAAPLYLDQFAFYLLRRALGDMTVRLERVLTVNKTDREDEEALQEIEAWGFQQWRTLDHTLQEIADSGGVE